MNGTICHAAHAMPRIMLDARAPQRAWSPPMTYPDQPAYSPMARTKNTANRTGTINIGNCGSRMDFPISGIRKYVANMVAGISRNIGMYQSLFLIRLGSKTFSTAP